MHIVLLICFSHNCNSSNGIFATTTVTKLFLTSSLWLRFMQSEILKDKVLQLAGVSKPHKLVLRNC